MRQPPYHPKRDAYCLQCKSLLEKIWYDKYVPGYYCSTCDQKWTLRMYNILKLSGSFTCFYCGTLLDKENGRGSSLILSCPECNRQWKGQKEFNTQREAYEKLQEWNRKASQ